MKTIVIWIIVLAILLPLIFGILAYLNSKV